MSEVLKTSVEDGIAIMSLNRPEASNALSLELLDQIDKFLEKLVNDSSVLVLILTGEGKRVFCAGADLKERLSMDEKESFNAVKKIHHISNMLASFPMPVICAMNGSAFGGGLELALATDIRIGASDSKFALSECSLGIIPGAGGTQRLALIVGVAKAKEMIFCASPIEAKKALDLGLLNYLASEKESPLDLALNMAKSMSKNAPLALRASKKAINFNPKLEDGLEHELSCYEEYILHSKDRLEGLKAFKEKRKPIFKGI